LGFVGRDDKELEPGAESRANPCPNKKPWFADTGNICFWIKDGYEFIVFTERESGPKSSLAGPKACCRPGIGFYFTLFPCRLGYLS
jgi:hypothetical protein